jgi:fluoride ion exporter CrcB/FEX
MCLRKKVEGKDVKLDFPQIVSVFTLNALGSLIISVFTMIININHLKPTPYYIYHVL